MNLIKPKFLNKGDTIAIIAPCGCVDIEKIQRAKKYFESKGFNVKLSSHIREKYNYLAGSDDQRLADLHCAFEDKEVSAIICARGGYGALRLVDKIDYELIRKNPKIFCGYSDITIFNSMFLTHSRLITYSGPMAQSDFGFDDINSFTEENFWRVVTGCNYNKLLAKNLVYYGKKTKCEGILFGGNLSTLASLCGRKFVPDHKFILVAEDLNEPTYKIDRYFTQLFGIYEFRKNISGIVLGDFLNIDNEEYFDDLMNDIEYNFDLPVVKGFTVSHSNRKSTIPIGEFAKLENGVFEIVKNF